MLKNPGIVLAPASGSFQCNFFEETAPVKQFTRGYCALWVENQ